MLTRVANRWQRNVGRMMTEWQWSQQNANRALLASLKDTHRGERCFIWGNGPSLGKMDLAPLKGEFNIWLNRGYLIQPETGYGPDLLVAVNRYVIEQFWGELLAVSGLKLLDFAASRDTRMLPAQTGFIRCDSPLAATFTPDITKPIWGGGTVTYTAMQIAYHMGFSQVILIGVDHHFETQGEPGKVVTLGGPDPNHFDPAYFGGDIKWQLPKLELSERAYRLARVAYERDGRTILDATIGGRLQVFPQIPYSAVAAQCEKQPQRNPLMGIASAA